MQARGRGKKGRKGDDDDDDDEDEELPSLKDDDEEFVLNTKAARAVPALKKGKGGRPRKNPVPPPTTAPKVRRVSGHEERDCHRVLAVV